MQVFCAFPQSTDTSHKEATSCFNEVGKRNACDKAIKMNEEKQEETPEEAEPSPQENLEEKQPEEGEEKVVESEPESEEDHFKKELEVLEGKKPQRTELEKAIHTREQIDKRIVDLGGESLLKKEQSPQVEFVTKDDFAENYARTLARSQDELKVIMWHYRNGIQKTGNIHEDIDNAHWLANKGRVKKLYEEIDRGKEKPSFISGPGQKVKNTLFPEMPKEDQAMLKRRGFSFNPKTGRWEAKHNAYRYDPIQKAWVSEKK